LPCHLPKPVSIPQIAAYEAALQADHKRYTIDIYPNVNYAFNNDTGRRAAPSPSSRPIWASVSGL
jgi:carboxymethylenebutenolidase